MTVNYDLMRQVHRSSLAGPVGDRFGQAGEARALQLVAALPTIHRSLPVELLPDGLVVFICLTDDATFPGFGESLSDLAMVQPHPHRGFTVQVTSAGFRLRTEVADPSSFADSIGYRFRPPGQETWHVNGGEFPVFNPIEGSARSFASLLFTDLEDALDDYALKMVQECRCLTLANGWLQPQRIYWRQRPEVQVRRSLELFLVSRLRDVLIEVEHVVDESKPVDVVVRWNLADRMALIECKWMGVSASEVRPDGSRSITKFHPGDAISGLRQLANYLDLKRQRAAGTKLKGHLVVVDGRRRGANDPDDGRLFSPQDLLFFEHDVVAWPSDLLARTDIASPRRMFCRPLLSGEAVGPSP